MKNKSNKKPEGFTLLPRRPEEFHDRIALSLVSKITFRKENEFLLDLLKGKETEDIKFARELVEHAETYEYELDKLFTVEYKGIIVRNLWVCPGFAYTKHKHLVPKKPPTNHYYSKGHQTTSLETDTIRFHSRILELVEKRDYKKSHLILVKNFDTEEIKTEILKVILNKGFPAEGSLGKILGFTFSKRKKLINQASESQKIISCVQELNLPNESFELRLRIKGKSISFLIIIEPN